MPVFEAGPGRELLAFAQAVRRSFNFLVSEFGFRLVDEQSTFVRYESDRAFVNVFHGRGSYELGVEFGRWIDVNGELVEQKFALGDVVELDHDPHAVGYREFATTEKEPLAQFVDQLASWTKQFAVNVLSGDAETFERLSAQNVRYWAIHDEQLRAQRLRARAQEAWQKRDYATVVNAYSEIDQELLTVELYRFEAGRLKYAQKKLESE